MKWLTLMTEILKLESNLKFRMKVNNDVILEKSMMRFIKENGGISTTKNL